jgi:The GLUG motif
MRANLLCGAAFAALLAAPAFATVTISTGKTKNMTCQDGACVPTARVANLNVTDLANMLAAGDAKVFTGNGAVSIQVTAPFSWTSSSMLTLTADHSVSFRAGVTVAGPGGLTIVDNRLNDGGQLVFSPGGSVSFWDTTNALSINAVSFTLVADLATLASDIAANPAGAYALTKNYNAFSDGIYLHSPIPTPFTGTFEGLGNTIDQISIQNGSDNDSETGLFSEIDSGGTVGDIYLTNLNINVHNTSSVGGLVGDNMGGTIVNALTSGTVTGIDYVGGLVGVNEGGTILVAQSSVNISGGEAGGIAGYDGGTITSAHASGTVSSGSQVAGGLVGEEHGKVSLSSASGNVGGARYGGGFVGYSFGAQITSCFATGAVGHGAAPKGGARGSRGGLVTGGFVGYSTSSEIQYSYATGSVTGVGAKHTTPGAGGFAGRNESWISSSYSTGKVTSAHDRGYVGGLVGIEIRSNGSSGLSKTVWDIDTSGIDATHGAGNKVSEKGVKGLTTAEFTSGLPKEFDPNVWAETPGINNGYPYLLGNPPH